MMIMMPGFSNNKGVMAAEQHLSVKSASSDDFKFQRPEPLGGPSRARAVVKLPVQLLPMNVGYTSSPYFSFIVVLHWFSTLNPQAKPQTQKLDTEYPKS